MEFKNRTDAGEKLCKLLTTYKQESVIVYALPRGGVIVAEPIARLLKAPLKLLFTRKIGHPLQPEWAIAAVSESGFLVKNPHVTDYVSKEWLEEEKRKEIQNIKRRKRLYTSNQEEPDLKNKIVIVVDDGIATGLTLEAGLLELKNHHPKQIVIAVPVSPQEIASKLRPLVDAFISLNTPSCYRGSVGSYYDTFDQVSDKEVIDSLARSL